MPDNTLRGAPGQARARDLSESAPAGPGEMYQFGGFTLDPVARLVTCNGKHVALTARLFDTLLYLVEHRQRAVDRDELLASVWAGRHVEDGTAGRTISSLRAILREHGAPDTLITTTPNRGYRLSMAVKILPLADAMAVPAVQQGRFHWPGAILIGAGLCAGFAALLWTNWVWRHQAPAFMPPAHSVAVLPFDSPGGDAADANMADGLAEELITALGRVDQLRVVSLRSSFMFRGHTTPLEDIAHRLNVGTMLDGSVRRVGGDVHVTVHLTDAVSGYQIWSNTFDRDAGDVLAVQADIVRQAVTALKLTPPPDQARSAAPGGTASPQAWDAFFTGVALMSKGSQGDRAHALQSLTRAIALDPKFERAYEFRAGAAWQVATGPESMDVATQDRLLMQAVHDAETAVALAPQSGSAHGALGWALLGLGRDLHRAGAEFSIARKLAPGDGAIRAQSAIALLDLGQTDQAVEDARQSVELDPLSQDALLGAAYIFARAHRPDAYHVVMRHLKGLPGNDPELQIKDECIGALALGEFADAVALCKAAPTLFRPYGLAIAQWKLGRSADARAALRTLQAMLGDSGAFQYAEIYAIWGDKAASRHWLSMAVQMKDGQLADILADDFLSPVRDTPEFDAAARAVGLR